MPNYLVGPANRLQLSPITLVLFPLSRQSPFARVKASSISLDRFRTRSIIFLSSGIFRWRRYLALPLAGRSMSIQLTISRRKPWTLLDATDVLIKSLLREVRRTYGIRRDNNGSISRTEDRVNIIPVQRSNAKPSPCLSAEFP